MCTETLNKMGVTRLRLARCGARNNPIYRIVAVDSRKSRDSKPIEYVSATVPAVCPQTIVRSP